MQTRVCVQSRRTIRKFLPKSVPKEMIEKVISDALWAPSWGNTQPWEFIVVTGPALEKFKAENKNALMAGMKPSPEIQMPEEWSDTLKSRYKEVGKSVLSSLSIPRKDLEGRLNYYGEMFSIFDAPALLLVLLDKSLMLEYAMLDVGLFMQTFMLLACDRGLGTAALAASVNFPEILRKCLPVPENKRIAIGVAIGWPDPDAPVNRFQRSRASIDELVTWVN